MDLSRMPLIRHLFSLGCYLVCLFESWPWWRATLNAIMHAVSSNKNFCGLEAESASTPRFFDVIMKAVRVVLCGTLFGCCLAGMLGCRDSFREENRHKDRPSKTSHSSKSDAASESTSVGQLAEKESEQPVKHGNRPSRTRPVGHAVAMAGLLFGQRPPDGSLLIHDPADNKIGLGADGDDNSETMRGTHAWLGESRKCVVKFGKARPTIELADSRRYTIVGGVVLRPSDALLRMGSKDIEAHRMPDLSQNIRPEWRGLCAATAAADLIYYAGRRDKPLLAGKMLGPGQDADREADRLIAGTAAKPMRQESQQPPQAEKGSLAFLMGNVGGDGASAVNIAKGLRDWVGRYSAGNWRVDIDFFDEGGATQKPTVQFNHLQQWSAAVADGGGVVVLLWPGDQWAEAIDLEHEGEEHDSDPQFQELNGQEAVLIPSAKSTKESRQEGLESRSPTAIDSQAEETQASIEELQADVQEAAKAMVEKRYDRATRLATAIIERVLPLRFAHAQAEEILEEANRIAAESSRLSGEGDKPNAKVPTRFDG